MSNTEHEAFKGGIANQLFNMAQNGRLKPNLLSTPRIQNKLIMAFGKDGAQEFIERLKAEAQIASDTNRMMPATGSATGEILNAVTDQDATNAALLDLAHAGVHATTGNHMAAGARLLSGLKTLWARGKTVGMPLPVRNEIGRLLMLSPKELADHIRQQPQVASRISKFIAMVQSGVPQPAAVATTEVTAP